MTTTDPRVDAYIDEAAAFARPILSRVREWVHAALPDATEAIKWGVPHFTVGGKNVAGMAAFKAHAAVIIHGEDSPREGMGQLGNLGSLDDLPPEPELAARLRSAAAAITSGDSPRRVTKSKPEIPMPDDFAAALAESSQAQAVFDGFAPGYRRDYLEWVTGAKRAETRAKRITMAVEWIAEGKKRNWKYENC